MSSLLAPFWTIPRARKWLRLRQLRMDANKLFQEAMRVYRARDFATHDRLCERHRAVVDEWMRLADEYERDYFGDDYLREGER